MSGLNQKIQEKAKTINELEKILYQKSRYTSREFIYEKDKQETWITVYDVNTLLDEAAKQIQEDSNTEDEIETQVLTFADEKGKYKFPISETQFRQLKRRKWVRVAKILAILDGKEKAKP